MTQEELQALSREELDKLANEGCSEAQLFLFKETTDYNTRLEYFEMAMEHLQDFSDKDKKYLFSCWDFLNVDSLLYYIQEGVIKPDGWYHYIIQNLYYECAEYGICEDKGCIAYWFIRAAIEGEDVKSFAETLQRDRTFNSLEDVIDSIINDNYEYTASEESVAWLESKAAEGDAISMKILAGTVYRDDKEKADNLEKEALAKGYDLALKELFKQEEPSPEWPLYDVILISSGLDYMKAVKAYMEVSGKDLDSAKHDFCGLINGRALWKYDFEKLRKAFEETNISVRDARKVLQKYGVVYGIDYLSRLAEGLNMTEAENMKRILHEAGAIVYITQCYKTNVKKHY